MLNWGNTWGLTMSSIALDRRLFLKSAAAFSAGLALPWLTACGTATQPGLPGLSPAPGAAGTLPPSDPIAHLLRRTRFATRLEDYTEALTMGADAYLDSQLRAPSMQNPVYLEASARFPFTALPPPLNTALGLVAEQATQQLAEKTLFLAAYSDSQLFEVMVDFWTNHFNVENVTGRLPLFKLYEDNSVMRAHALGRFEDLLMGSAKSPAMLEYLDNITNIASGPNQNYARELMELHTLGVDGGYTEQDVREVARCFTGWNINGGTGVFQFNPGDHDDGEKTVLGQRIPAGGGVTDGETVLRMLAQHPSTARFIATKLAVRFVADQPPSSLVSRLAQVFTDTAGDIPSLLRALFSSAEFAASGDQKFKRPLEFVAGVLRSFHPDQNGYDGPGTLNSLSRMGQIPHRWFPPDGYPDRSDYWLNTSGLLERWNYAAQMVENPPALTALTLLQPARTAADTPALVSALAAELVQRPLRPQDAALLAELASGGAPLDDDNRTQQTQLIAGLLLASPYFTLR